MQILPLDVNQQAINAYQYHLQNTNFLKIMCVSCEVKHIDSKWILGRISILYKMGNNLPNTDKIYWAEKWCVQVRSQSTTKSTKFTITLRVRKFSIIYKVSWSFILVHTRKSECYCSKRKVNFTTNSTFLYHSTDLIQRHIPYLSFPWP